MTKEKQDFFARNGIILFKPQMGDNTIRRLCRECGGRAFDTGGNLCPTCFDEYFTKVLRANPQMVAVHAVCYSNDGPTIVQLEKCRSKEEEQWQKLRDIHEKRHGHCHVHTNPPDTNHWTYPNTEATHHDWMDAMSFTVNFMKNRG